MTSARCPRPSSAFGGGAGEAAAHDIRTYLDHGKHGGRPGSYKPAPVRIFSVPFGPEGGTTLLPALGHEVLVLGNRATSALKSGTLAVPTTRKLPGVTAD